MDRIFQKPKVIYRRISKQKYGPPKSKYGPPRQKHRPSKSNRKPGKKNRKAKPTSPKYGPPNPSKKRAPKPKHGYGPPKSRIHGRPSFGHVVKMPHYSFYVPEQAGFAEPPLQYVAETQKQSYGEPPVDSYGAPLKTSIKDVYSTPQSFQDSTKHFDDLDFNDEYTSWNHKQNQNRDTNFGYPKQQQTYSATDTQIFVTPAPKDYKEEFLDPDVPEKPVMQDNKFFFKKKRPHYFAENSKIVNKPWRPSKNFQEFDDEIIVGGEYAEPPARYAAKFQPSLPMYDDEDTFTPLNAGYIAELAASNVPRNSAYSNYKNSNMAFSPQNLNDVFSIVDK